MAAIVKEFDEDGSGALNEEELRELVENIKTSDMDHDGSLNREELRSMILEHRKAHAAERTAKLKAHAEASAVIISGTDSAAPSTEVSSEVAAVSAGAELAPEASPAPSEVAPEPLSVSAAPENLAAAPETPVAPEVPADTSAATADQGAVTAPSDTAAAPAAPATESRVNDATAGMPPSNAVALWRILYPMTPSVDGAELITFLSVLKSGFSENALRFALKAVDSTNSGAATEAQVWRAISCAINCVPSRLQQNHLRKAWRGAEKWQKPEEPAVEPSADTETAAAVDEDSTAVDGAAAGSGESEVSPPTAPSIPEEPKVVIESFIAQVTEDEVCASILLREIAFPIEMPQEAATDDVPPE
jgi:Ca2+-binding EF-hand superfamily protein